MRVRGIDFAPLLLRHAQIGKVTNVQRKLMIEESCLRGIDVNDNEKVAKTKTMFITHEHPNETSIEVKKHFNPKLLTATNWSKDARLLRWQSKR